MSTDAITAKRDQLASRLTRQGLQLAVAESCTGGWLAKACTDAAGSSAWFERGFVTYSNLAKQQMLGVKPDTLDFYGAVSRQCAEEMAKGVLGHAPVDLAVSITGIAGPTGGSPDKPVGLVHFAAASRGGVLLTHESRYGDLGRSQVRRLSVLQALVMLTQLTDTA